MKPVVRGRVKPGTFFATSENGPLVNVALAKHAEKCIKAVYRDTNRAWHVYTPTGSISWCPVDGIVWIEE